MELQRTQWSDIIAQYQSVFGLTQDSNMADALSDSALHGWLSSRVDYFVSTLDRYGMLCVGGGLGESSHVESPQIACSYR